LTAAWLNKKTFLLLTELFIERFGGSVRFPFVHDPTPVFDFETVSVGGRDYALPKGGFALFEGVQLFFFFHCSYSPV
jgi:hypothetical protein